MPAPLLVPFQPGLPSILRAEHLAPTIRMRALRPAEETTPLASQTAGLALSHPRAVSAPRLPPERSPFLSGARVFCFPKQASGSMQSELLSGVCHFSPDGQLLPLARWDSLPSIRAYKYFFSTTRSAIGGRPSGSNFELLTHRLHFSNNIVYTFFFARCSLPWSSMMRNFSSSK